MKAALQGASVEQYEGRTTVGMSEAVKTQHVLPFVPGIVSFAARVEALTPGALCLKAVRMPAAANRIHV